MSKAIAIVGGGLMGSLTALALSRQGRQVVLFEREPRLLSRASACNEGKIHLGFTYGLDPTGETQRRLFDYGANFRADIETILGAPIGDVILHERVVYAVERGSHLGPEEAERGVFANIRREAENRGFTGCEAAALIRRLPDESLRAIFGESVAAAYDVAEPLLDPGALCTIVSAAVEAETRITVLTGVEVSEIRPDPLPAVRCVSGETHGGFEAVVNAAWDGLPALAAGDAPRPSHCLRAKTGFIAEVLEGMPEAPVTFVWGGFGDFVPRPGGRAYISWYPACLMGFETDLREGPAWFDRVSGAFDFAQAYEASCAAFRRLMPGLVIAETPDETLAGPILAIARTDIDDPASLLHRRAGFGLRRDGPVVTADTGKLSCAPGLAREIGEMFA